MAAVVVDLAAAVVDALNAAQAAGTAFTDDLQWKAQKRLYVPTFELSQLSELKVVVVPRGRTTARLSRGHRKEEGHSIDVGVMQRVGGVSGAGTGIDEERVAALLLLVEELGDYLMENAISSPEAVVLTIENDPVYDAEEMEERRVFVSVLTVAYRHWRA